MDVASSADVGTFNARHRSVGHLLDRNYAGSACVWFVNHGSIDKHDLHNWSLSSMLAVMRNEYVILSDLSYDGQRFGNTNMAPRRGYLCQGRGKLGQDFELPRRFKRSNSIQCYEREICLKGTTSVRKDLSVVVQSRNDQAPFRACGWKRLTIRGWQLMRNLLSNIHSDGRWETLNALRYFETKLTFSESVSIVALKLLDQSIWNVEHIIYTLIVR